MQKPVTNALFNDFLRCEHKAYLKLAGQSGQTSEYEEVESSRARTYHLQARERLLRSADCDDVAHRGLPLTDVLERRPEVVADVALPRSDVHVRFDALIRSSDAPPVYVPVLFAHREKLAKEDKLLLAFCGLILEQRQGVAPPFGKIVHGGKFTAVKVHLAKLSAEAGEVLKQVSNLIAGGSQPRLCLNRHCNSCEFSEHCRSVAVAEDDLSLIGGLPLKEIVRLNNRGIFTVKQFSYTYRPRRRARRSSGRPPKYYHSLQAMAIRTAKTYVARKPDIPNAHFHLFMDVEGLPDEDFYYLIGLLICDEDEIHWKHFWADTKGGEAAMWADFLGVIVGLEDFHLYHYGSYESKFIARMTKLYGGDTDILGKLVSSSTNILSLIYANVYFPTYSNGLKDVARHLGADWTDPRASGLQSIAWRKRWEERHEEALKQRLIIYNREDCSAARAVTTALRTICDGDSDRLPSNVVETASIKPEGRMEYGPIDFVLPKLKRINECAYFDYQRSKVYIRTSRAVKTSLRREQRRRREGFKVDQNSPLRTNGTPTQAFHGMVAFRPCPCPCPCPNGAPAPVELKG